MRLLRVNEQYEVEVEPWVLLVPEFSVLFKRDKGSPGDYRGDKKLIARKQVAYVYFMVDFTSPIREWPDEALKQAEARRYTGLEEDQIDDLVEAAVDYYIDLQYKAAPSLKTLESIRKGRDGLNNYFEGINFKATDKLNRLINNPKDYIDSIARMGMMDDAINKYERRVYEELKAAGTGVRGKGTLGGQEGKRREKAVWREGGPPAGDPDIADLETQEV